MKQKVSGTGVWAEVWLESKPHLGNEPSNVQYRCIK